MHQPGEGGQVGHVKVVGLVQHQVAGQQAQHGRNLAATAQAFGGGGEAAKGFDDVRLTPTTFLLDKRGQVVQKFLGEPDFDKLHARIAQLLAEPA